MARAALRGSLLLGWTVVMAAGAAFVVIPILLATPVEPHDDLTSALIRSGLDAESLAAAGVSAEETTTLVGLANAELDGAATTLSSLDGTYAEARRERDRLKRLVQSGLGSAQDVTDYQQAETDLAAAEAAREAFLGDVFGAATAHLSGDEVATLEAIHANRHWRLPTQYLVVDRTEEQWVDLRDALANLRISQKYGEEPDDACESHVATCELDADVAAAGSSLDASCGAVESAWDSAAG